MRKSFANKLALGIILTSFLWQQTGQAEPGPSCLLRAMAFGQRQGASFDAGAPGGAPVSAPIRLMREFMNELQGCTDFLAVVRDKTASSLDDDDIAALKNYSDRFKQIHQRAAGLIGSGNDFVLLAGRAHRLMYFSYNEIAEMRNGMVTTKNLRAEISDACAAALKELEPEDFELDDDERRELTREVIRFIRWIEDYIAEYQTLFEAPYIAANDRTGLRSVRTKLAKITTDLGELKTRVTTKAGLSRRFNVIRQILGKLEQLLDEWADFSLRDAMQSNISALHQTQQVMGGFLDTAERLARVMAAPRRETLPSPDETQRSI